MAATIAFTFCAPAEAGEPRSVRPHKMRFRVLHHEINERRPLIYMWEIRSIEGVLLGRYIGKAKEGSGRPLKHYKQNVANILQGKPYRRGNPTGYRRIHLALAKAEREGLEITLRFLCNVGAEEDINAVEQDHIKLHKSCGDEKWQLNG